MPDAPAAKGALSDGVNLMATASGRRAVRGGSQVLVTYSAVGGNAISDVPWIGPYSACGAVVVTHTTAGAKHYAYAHTDELGWAITDEATSRADLVWNSATMARPLGVELFEKLYLVDAREATTRQGMAVATFTPGSFTIANPVYDLNASGGGTAVLRAYSAEVFNGVLFVSGYDHEAAVNSGTAPHLVRHSLLGTDPASATGFDADAWNIFGAKGQWVRAMRAGRTVLLVAKDNELYLVSGAGRALPGWQYQIQQLTNSIGAGATNPYALDHALGMWYGIGRIGPWRSDGGNVELLRPTREKSWARVDLVEKAVVRYHASRNQVWYGMYETGNASYGTAPYRWWVWDVQREQWDLSQQFARSFHFLGTVSHGGTTAPASTPGNPQQDFDYGFDFTAFEGTFVSADTTAETEVWSRDGGGSSALQTTVGTGITRFRVTGKTHTTAYYVKIRHKKSGNFTEFTPEVMCYTRVLPPTLQVGSTGTTDPATSWTIYATNAAATGVSLIITTAGATYSGTFLNEPVGVRTITGVTVTNTGETFSAKCTHPSWPATRQDSPTVTAHQRGPEGFQIPANCTQQFGFALPTGYVIGNFWPNVHQLGYTMFVGGVGVGIGTSAFNGQPLAPMAAERLGLTTDTSYQVFMRTSSDSGFTTLYTGLSAVTSVVVTSTGTPGTPVVNIAVTTARACVVRIYNADRTYDQQQTIGAAGTHNYTSNVGGLNVKDQYWVRVFKSTWPAGYQYSDAMTDTVDNPQGTGS